MTRPRSRTVIEVEGLAKEYRLGAAGGAADLREALGARVRRGFARLRHRDDQPTDTRRHLWALRDVSFDVRQGEVLGIVGRNGAGKSTLLKILSRISPPSAGHARIEGRVGSLLEVGTGFHPDLSGRENTYLNGAILGMSRREVDRCYDSIVDYAGIAGFMDTPVKRYSSGMRVRLGFAIAAHVRPEILILDEVLAVGDLDFQRKSSQTILDFAAAGNTVLFVSHNLHSVRSICSRALLLEHGRVTHVGTPDDTLRVYQESTRPVDRDGLIARPREIPGMTPLIALVDFRDAAGAPTTRVPSCDGLTVRVSLRNETPLEQAFVEVVVKDAFGARIGLVTTDVQQASLGTVPRHGTVCLDFEQLPLLPGTYYVTVGVGAHGERLDLVDRAAEFQVEWADVYGTGELQDNARGSVVLRAQGRIEGGTRTAS